MRKREAKLPYLPQIDGIRGISVIAVILFHLGFAWADGGYLGVEAFFVVSGFLITSLVISDFATNKSISLREFWKRRAKRLLPILYVLLGATIILTLYFARDYLIDLREDVAAAIGYFTNWFLIFDHQAYFEAAGRPSPLLHLWSLAIEEQFYIFWPLVIGWLLKKRNFKLAMGLIGALIIGSQLWSGYLFDHVGVDRAYYGTDTRLVGLLVGSMAAIMTPLHMVKMYRKRQSSDFLKFIGWLGIPFLLFVVAAFYSIDPGSAWLFRGGFLIFDLAVVLLIFSVVLNPKTLVTKFLSSKFMVWVGTRSYGLYLWHWVIFQFTRPGTDIALTGFANTMLRLSLTVAITELTYRLVENPLRRSSSRKIRLFTKQSALAATVVMFSLSVIFISRPAVIAGNWPPPEVSLAQKEISGELGGLEEVQIVELGPALTPAEALSQAAAEVKEQLEPHRPPGLITVIGDSVVLGAAKSIPEIIGNPLVLDAKVSRFPHQLEDLLKKLDKEKKLGNTVVIALGTNGEITHRHIIRAMKYLEGRQVVWVEPRGERTWIRDSISRLRKEIPDYENTELVNWAKISKDKTGWFTVDGIHVNKSGAKRYAQYINRGIWDSSIN